MRFRSLVLLLSAIGVVWLVIETGDWAKGLLLPLGQNGLFWLFWIFVWLTLVLSAICYDFWRRGPHSQ